MGYLQCANDAVIAQSIAGGPTRTLIREARLAPVEPEKTSRVEVELGLTIGWEEHAPNRGRLGTAEILGGL
jgi:hypothetical protein